MCRIVESLYCTLETNITLFVNYTGIKKKGTQDLCVCVSAYLCMSFFFFLVFGKTKFHSA